LDRRPVQHAPADVRGSEGIGSHLTLFFLVAKFYLIFGFVSELPFFLDYFLWNG
jgi:hypothetical protein